MLRKLLQSNEKNLIAGIKKGKDTLNFKSKSENNIKLNENSQSEKRKDWYIYRAERTK